MNLSDGDLARLIRSCKFRSGSHLMIPDVTTTVVRRHPHGTELEVSINFRTQFAIANEMIVRSDAYVTEIAFDRALCQLRDIVTQTARSWYPTYDADDGTKIHVVTTYGDVNDRIYQLAVNSYCNRETIMVHPDTYRDMMGAPLSVLGMYPVKACDEPTLQTKVHSALMLIGGDNDDKPRRKNKRTPVTDS